MASAQFTVDGVVPSGAVEVSAGSTHSLALIDATGLRSVVWSVVGSHSSSATEPTITPGGSPLGATASIEFVAGSPQGFLLQCVVDGGVGTDGKLYSDYTAQAIIGVADDSGYVPFVAGEELERSLTHGLYEELNERLTALSSGSGTGPDVLSSLIEVDNGSGPYTATYLYAPTVAEGEQFPIGVYVDIWRGNDRSVASLASAVVVVSQHSSTFGIVGSPNSSWDLSAMDPQFGASIRIDGPNIAIDLTSSTAVARARVRLYFRDAELMEELP